MRKRNIKTVAHWVIMCFLLLFPIVLVGISAFANDEQSVTVTETYEFETNEVNSQNDLVNGNIYQFTINTLTENEYDFYGGDFGTNFFSIVNYDLSNIITFSNQANYANYAFEPNNLNYDYLSITINNIGIDLYEVAINCDDANDNYSFSIISNVPNTNDFLINFYVVCLNKDGFLYIDGLKASDYLGEVTTTVDIQNSNYKQEVNNWANGFKNLPVNQWYGQLLNVVGVGQTTNSVMNVIYVYPLYVLWVYLIDLILDCLLVIVNLGHNVLKRVDGDIE